MGVEQHRHAAALELEQQVAHDPAADRVERAGGLVEHQQPRGAHQRLGDAEPLLHALRHRVDLRVPRASARPTSSSSSRALGGAAVRAGEPLVQRRAARRRAATGEAEQLGQVADAPPRRGRAGGRAVHLAPAARWRAPGRRRSSTSVDLPAPLGPSRPTSSPRLDLQIDARERHGRAVALLSSSQAKAAGTRAQCRKLPGVPLLDEVRATAARSPASARYVSIDLDAARDARARRRRPRSTPSATTSRAPRGRGRLPAHARRDQLRLGLVPDAAQAARAARATSRWPGRWPTVRRAGPWPAAELRGSTRAERGRGARPGPGPRADGASTPRRCASSAASSASAARSTLVDEAGGSAERLAAMLARGHAASSTTAASTSAPRSCRTTWRWPGVAEFADLDRLTIFADNLVPHVLRVDGVLRYDPELAARIDAGELLPPGGEEREIRACALHACEQIAERDRRAAARARRGLWNRGQAAAATRRCRATARARSTTGEPAQAQPPVESGPRRPLQRARPRRPRACGRSARPPAPRAR